jgi:uncharacterized protein
MERDKRLLPQQYSGVRALSEADAPTYITGKGIVFGQPSERMRLGAGHFVEYIDNRALEGVDLSNTVAFFNHDPNYILGSVAARTLDLNITEGAVEYRIQVPDTQTIRDLVVSPISRGDVRGSSFMFNVKDDEWEYDKSEQLYTRYIKRISAVYEMGPVSTPAYRQTTSELTARSLDSFIAQVQTQEAHYRRNWLTRRLRINP